MAKSKEICAKRSFGSESMPFSELAGSWQSAATQVMRQRTYGGLVQSGILQPLLSLNLMS